MRLIIIGSLGGHMPAAAAIAHERGARVTSVDTVDGAIDSICGGLSAELCLIDVQLDVASLIARLRDERIKLPVVACGVEGGRADLAAKAIEDGAEEYLTLPPDPELIAAVLEAAGSDQRDFIFGDPAMTAQVRMAEQIAASQASVLITGESGSGKEVMARFIHNHSPRASKRFVAVNCAAIPDTLLESELFGHEKGAFSGATQRRIGRFEEANGGTVLLDEISEMDARLQAKLLRVLQEREVDRLGSSQPVAVDIRVLATSNRDLATEIDQGRFREDLYFRLNVVNLSLPPLRDRPLDVQDLADHFNRKYSEENGIPQRPFSAEARAVMRSHRWPGNVRELENAVHRAVLLAHGDAIAADALALAGPARGRTLEEVEQDAVLSTLNACFGDQNSAARILGISLRSLRQKLDQYAKSSQAAGHAAGDDAVNPS